MRKPGSYSLRAAILLAVAFTAFACPSGLDYPLAEKPDMIDPALLGTWVALSDEAEMLEVSIRKKDDYSYAVEVLENSEGYMLDATKFTSWVARMDGHSFLYSQPAEGDDEKYYLYHYAFEDGILVIHDVGLMVGGTDAVSSTATLRKEVSASLKRQDCLSSRLEYEKK